MAGSPKEEETWRRPAGQLREESAPALRLPNRKVQQTGKAHSLGLLSLSQHQGGAVLSAVEYFLEAPGRPSLCCALTPPPPAKGEERAVGRQEGEQKERADWWPGHWLRATDRRGECLLTRVYYPTAVLCPSQARGCGDRTPRVSKPVGDADQTHIPAVGPWVTYCSVPQFPHL